MLSTRFNRLTIALLRCAALAVPAQLAAQTPDHPTDNTAQFPTKNDLKSLTTAGSYLAPGMPASTRDASSAAAFPYRSALRTDPKNSELLDRAFISSLADGDIEEAVKLADRILTQDKANRVARLVVGVRDLQAEEIRRRAGQHQPVGARSDHRSGRHAAVGLAAPLALVTARRVVASIDKLTGPEWYPIFKDLHAGMIYEFAGQGGGCRHALRARLQARRSDAAHGRRICALDLAQQGRQPPPPQSTRRSTRCCRAIRWCLTASRRPRRGKKLPPLVDSPQAGAAEALYGIGATLTCRGGEDLALVYLQLALYLQPNHPLVLLSLADLYESVKKPQMAIKVYERMPASSPLKRNAADPARDQSRRRRAQRRGDQDPQGGRRGSAEGHRGDPGARQCRQRGRKKLRRLRRPPDSQAIDALPPAAATRTPGSPIITAASAEERSKQWNKAEADMRKALELQPEQPHVLNYLGYSWIDQGINLDEGMKMIKRAVDQRPDDGYIVDSLGWAYYRIGNYDEAVKNLERAIDLKPEDPTINDHLGDAYWRVGRKLEAKFQWAHARDLKPEPEELPKIQAKIDNGLPDDTLELRRRRQEEG